MSPELICLASYLGHLRLSSLRGLDPWEGAEQVCLASWPPRGELLCWASTMGSQGTASRECVPSASQGGGNLRPRSGGAGLSSRCGVPQPKSPMWGSCVIPMASLPHLRFHFVALDLRPLNPVRSFRWKNRCAGICRAACCLPIKPYLSGDSACLGGCSNFSLGHVPVDRWSGWDRGRPPARFPMRS